MLFNKPYKIRTNTLLRQSNKRKFLEAVVQHFGINPDELNSHLRDRAVNEVKLTLQTRVDVVCYLFDGIPFLFQYEKYLVPTVYFLNLLPNIAKIFFTNEETMKRLQSGADLMLPGVLKSGKFSNNFADLHVGSICGVAVFKKTSTGFVVSKPMCVGLCQMTFNTTPISDGPGKFALILHTIDDGLSQFISPNQLSLLNLNETKNFFLNGEEPKFGDTPSYENEVAINSNSTADSDSASTSNMDELLEKCFLCGLSALNLSELPLPINVFYAKFMKLSNPLGVELNIKKTSFKKHYPCVQVGAFLHKMMELGYIKIKEEKPGIINLVSVSENNQRLEELRNQSVLSSPTKVTFITQIQSSAIGEFYFGPPAFEQVRIISSHVAPFFAAAGYSKGDGISPSEINRIAREYIASENLSSPDDFSLVKIDSLLMRVCDPNCFVESSKSTLANPMFEISFPHIITSLTKGLQVAHLIKFPETSGLQPILHNSTSIPKMRVYTMQQCGKTVTRIGFLSIFGIDPRCFSRFLQTYLACSSNIVEDSRCGSAISVQVQGDHSISLSKLLTEKFGISSSWIDGYTEVKKRKQTKINARTCFSKAEGSIDRSEYPWK